MCRTRIQLGRWLAVLLLGFTVACGGTESEQPAPAANTSGDSNVAEVTAPTGTASIGGTVVYKGEVPRLQPIDMSAEPTCAAKHTDAIVPEVLVLGGDNTMANILVKISSGLPPGKWPVPTEPVTMDQEGCRYSPHVIGVRVGQPFRVLNSDGILHNVHALPTVNQEFNMAMPASRTEADKVFDKVEDPFRIKCDVHPWMGAWITVLDHPFFSVTGKDGKYEIAGLPAGTYTIEAWHERLGTRSADVTVADGQAGSADFVFSR